MKWQRVRGFISDFIIIVISFEVSERLATTMFRTDKWFVELILYVITFMGLQGIVYLGRFLWRKIRKQ